MDSHGIGDRIKAKRTEMGWSQQALASESGIPQGTLSRVEAGRRCPGAQLLIDLADAMNVSVDWLLGRSTENPFRGLSASADRGMKG